MYPSLLPYNACHIGFLPTIDFIVTTQLPSFNFVCDRRQGMHAIYLSNRYAVESRHMHMVRRPKAIQFSQYTPVETMLNGESRFRRSKSHALIEKSSYRASVCRDSSVLNLSIKSIHITYQCKQPVVFEGLIPLIKAGMVADFFDAADTQMTHHLAA